MPPPPRPLEGQRGRPCRSRWRRYAGPCACSSRIGSEGYPWLALGLNSINVDEFIGAQQHLTVFRPGVRSRATTGVRERLPEQSLPDVDLRVARRPAEKQLVGVPDPFRVIGGAVSQDA